MILLKRFTDLRIGTKLGILFGLIILFGWLNGFFLFSLVDNEKQSGRIINVVGRQRMLTQKMAKEAFIIWSQNSTQEDIENIGATRTLFEHSHHGLRYGDPSMGLPQMDIPAAISQWEIVDELWTKFRLSIINIEELGRAASSTHIDQIIEQSLPIVNEIDILVGIFEEDARAKNSLILIGSLFSAIIITVVGTFCIIYINRAVSQPLIKVSETARTIAEGNIAVEFNVEEEIRTDEIGILHVSLKDMQTTMRARIEKSEKLLKALRAAKGEHQLLLEKLMEGVLLEDSEGKITFLNPRMAEMLRYTEEELLGKHWSFLVPSGEVEKIRKQTELRRDDITGKYESTLLAKDGYLVPVIVTATPILTDSRVFRGVLTVFTDITERKLAEKALRKSEERYHAIVEDQTEMISRYKPDGTLTFVNEAVCRYLGLSRDELLGQSFLPFLPQDDLVEVKKHLASLNLETPVSMMENRVILPNGGKRWHQWTNRGIFDKQGRLVEIQSTGMDITDRKRAEKAVREAKEQYQMLLENSEVGILSIDITEGKINYFNPMVGQILDYSSDRLNSMTLFDFIVPDNVAEVKNILQRKIKEENLNNTIVEDYEFQAVRGNGNSIWLKMKMSPIVRIEKRPEVQCYFWDITQEKELQEIQDRFIVTTSHELRTPITVIRGWVEFLGKHPQLSRDQLNSIYISIHRSIHRLTRLIDAVHDLTTLRGSHFTISRRMISINEFIETLQEEIRLVYPRRTILINYHESKNLIPQIYFDPDRIFQVIHNLVSNAVKNSPRDSIVEITIMRHSKEILIQIEDHGVGISVENLFQIFQPFSHLPTEYSVAGIGLGLYITKNIIHTHGGTITLETRENKGTNFLVTIPTVSST